ncbi:LysR family transcriptional regulator [Thalassotalea mangrovi]|uniref:LysR family transcriptional regulator n=1 Tax=Thalassotalea mangrovi TaxID=2572245 RepID=A0A4U1B649_9GAMM|nr:LysR family transcriptional regulator [Thalassotalea mangrovi]TKB45381.1 LysR family transcriptional regulator [Thalassotalea mangrovi]
MAFPLQNPRQLSDYDLRLLKVFQAVVEHGGFAAAEAHLGITKSTISIHISNLEQRMGFTLCQRGRSGFTLTHEGQSIYHATLNLFESVRDFSLLVGSLGAELSGELVIWCSEQLDQAKQLQFAQVIEQIHQQHSGLQIELDAMSIDQIEKGLLQGKVHVGIYPAYHKVDGLEYLPIHQEQVFLCCSNRHPFFHKTDHQISDQDFANAETIHPGIDITGEGKAQLEKFNLTAKSYQFHMRKILINSGQYLGFMPQGHIQRELNSGTMRLLRPNSINYDFTLSLVYHKQPREAKKQGIAISAIEKVFVDN